MLVPIDCRLPHLMLHGVSTGEREPGSKQAAKPLALFFHGITANAYVFTPIMEALASVFHCVSFDQRGHGRSDKPPTGYGAADFATDIAALIAHFDAGPALLIGHSLGARNALAAGVQFPDRVAGMVAIDFTPYIEPQVFDELEARVNSGDRVFEHERAVQAYLTGRYPRLPADAIERRTRYGYVAAAGGLRPLADSNAMTHTARGLREELAPTLRDIRVPTLLIRGADSKLVSPRAWQRSMALRPDIQAIELGGTDHYVPEELPQEVAECIRVFWKSISH